MKADLVLVVALVVALATHIFSAWAWWSALQQGGTILLHVNRLGEGGLELALMVVAASLTLAGLVRVLQRSLRRG